MSIQPMNNFEVMKRLLVNVDLSNHYSAALMSKTNACQPIGRTGMHIIWSIGLIH